MLAADASTRYINEPLNVNHRPGILRKRVARWYEYVCDENQHEYVEALRETIGFRYHLRTELRSLRSIRDIARLGRDFTTFQYSRTRGQRALLKDPFAIFSAPWFAKELDCRVVVMVRHPAAFAASLQRLRWPFDFSDLLDQPLLMRDRLDPYRAEMSAMDPQDVVGQASLLWKMIYASVRSFERSVPGLISVRHEDLSVNPIDGFRHLYSRLHLDFSSRVEAFIGQASSSENPKASPRGRADSVKLDSASNVKLWKRLLPEKDVDRIRTATEEVARFYYSNEDW